MTATQTQPIEWTPHPVLKVPTREMCLAWGAERTLEVYARREELIRLERDDAFRHAYIPQTWRDADEILPKALLLSIFGGGGAAKSHYCCWKAVHTLVAQPQSRVLLLHESERSSIDTHQRFVYHYLPREWKPTEERKMKRTLTTKVNYSIANGFTDNIFVLPNGSQCVFGSYKQDVKDYEGGGWSLVVADENLPLFWLLTLLYRLPRAGGRLLWPFTPIKGITPAVKHIILGAQTLRSKRAELLPEDHQVFPGQDWPKGEMPYLQKSVHPRTYAMFFRTQDNPWSGYEDQKLLAATSTTEMVERRFYGYARNSTRTLFPLFSAVHVVAHEDIPFVKDPKSPVTRYQFLDPAGVRNIFTVWVGVDGHGRHWVYDEWPDEHTHGEWAVQSEQPNKWDGDPGPAQASIGMGVVQYKQLYLSREGHRFTVENGTPVAGSEAGAVTIEERYVDPRSGAAGTITEEDGGSSLIDRFEEEQHDSKGGLIGPEMILLPAPGLHEREGIEAINNLLNYNPGQALCPLLNEPRLRVSSRCRQVVFALQNYTGHDGEKAACKDPVDCLRYMATAELEHVPGGRAKQGRIKTY